MRSGTDTCRYRTFQEWASNGTRKPSKPISHSCVLLLTEAVDFRFGPEADLGYFRFASDLATTDRNVFKNSSATGLSALFLTVTTETGARVSGSLTGNLLKNGYRFGTTE